MSGMYTPTLAAPELAGTGAPFIFRIIGTAQGIGQLSCLLAIII